MLAFATGISEFALNEEKGEHEKLARAAERVARHYNIPVPDPVTRDWIMLAKTAGIIYGGRALAYYNRTQSAPRAVPQRTVTPAQNPVRQAPNPPPAEQPQSKPVRTLIDVPGFGKKTCLQWPDGRIEYVQ